MRGTVWCGGGSEGHCVLEGVRGTVWCGGSEGHCVVWRE